MKKAYSYKRFSTPEQSKGDSIRRQTKAAEIWAAGNDVELDTDLSIDDLGVSAYRGANATDGMLSQFLEAVRSGFVEQGSYLLVENLDRISRQSPMDAVILLRSICLTGITVVTLNDNREYTAESLGQGFNDLLIAVLSFARANEESEVKSQRLKAAWSEKRKHADKRPITSRGPAWLKLDKDKQLWSKIPDRVKVVNDIFDWTLNGIGQHGIANKLNQSKVPVFGRGKFWHRSYIAKILSNNSVLGNFTPHTISYIDGKKHSTPLDTITDYYPAIISAEKWSRTQSLKEHSTNPKRGRHAGNITNNLLGGLGRCPLCASTMTLVNKGKRSKPKLVCTKAKTGAGCNYHSVLYEVVESCILKSLPEIAYDMPSSNTSGIDELVIGKEAEIEGIDISIDNYLETLGKEGPTDLILKTLNERVSNRSVAEKELDALLNLRDQSTSLIVKSKMKNLQQEAAKGIKMDRTIFNALLRQIFKCVIINYPTGYLDFEWQQDGWTTQMFAWPTGQSEVNSKAT